MVSWISPEEGSSGVRKRRVETLPVLVDVEGELWQTLSNAWWTTQTKLGPSHLVNSSHLGEAPRWSPSEPVIFRQRTFLKTCRFQKTPQMYPWFSFKKSPAPMETSSWKESNGRLMKPPKKKLTSIACAHSLRLMKLFVGTKGKEKTTTTMLQHGIYPGKKMDDGL